MTTILIVAIIAAVAYYIYYLSHGNNEQSQTDPNAIKVLTPDDNHVGYVPKDMTDEIRDNATLPCQCFCYIGENDGIYFSDSYILRPNVSPK